MKNPKLVKIVKIQSSDEQTFEVDAKVAQRFGLIKNMLETPGMENNVVELPYVHSAYVRLLLKYAEFHKNEPIPTDEDVDERTVEGISAWDTEFMNLDNGVVFGLIEAAKLLKIKELVNLAYMSLAKLIRGKTTEEIRAAFGVVNNFTPEEEEAIRNEHNWMIEEPDENMD